MSVQPSHAPATSILEELDGLIAFQRTWRRRMNVAYAGATVGALVGTTAATLSAAFGYARTAAVCSAIATLLISLEKALNFRDKWRHHLAILIELENARLSLSRGGVDDTAAADMLKKIRERYARELPVEARN